MKVSLIGVLAFSTGISAPHCCSRTSIAGVMMVLSGDADPYGLVLLRATDDCTLASSDAVPQAVLVCSRRPLPVAVIAGSHVRTGDRETAAVSPLLSEADASPLTETFLTMALVHGSILVMLRAKPTVCTCTGASPATRTLPMALLRPSVMLTSCTARRAAAMRTGSPGASVGG